MFLQSAKSAVPMKQIFDVQTPTSSYPVFSGSHPEVAIWEVWRERWKQAALITDRNTARFAKRIARSLRSEGIQVFEETFTPGEASKTRETKADIEDRLLEAGFGRSGCIVAVGGGVTLDLAGFVAATYMRGVPHVNVATSLLAQVDAAIGGKTGVNTPHGKNLVGAFHHPRAVLLDTEALRRLPNTELACGMAELVKHAVIADAGLLDDIESASGRLDIDALAPLITRGAHIKARIVAQDENERGVRRVLNLGHTIGHGIERATGYRVPHGEAVATGMVVEAQIAHRIAGFSAEQVQRIAEILSRLGLPVQPPVSFESVAAHMRYDKKTKGSAWRFALPERIGKMESAGGEWVVEVGADRVAAAFEQVRADPSLKKSFG